MLTGDSFLRRVQPLIVSSFISVLNAPAGIRRRYTVAEFEKVADDFAKKRFGCAGSLPDRLVEVQSHLTLYGGIG